MTPKRISENDIIGARGVALISQVVAEMGFVWYATGLEAGIDGYIEIRDPSTEEVTNQIIQVQSKATERSFRSETLEGFDYYCDRRDLDYWLGGNAPVILVVSRPSTGEAYWVSIKDYFKDPQSRSTPKVHFSKPLDRFTPSCREALAALARPRDSGFYLAPLPVQETVYSNLLEVKRFATKLHIAETDYRSRRELFGTFHQMGTRVGGEWILKDKRIISFHDLSEYPWCEICDQGTADTYDCDEWAYSDDLDIQRDFVHLLSASLRELLYPNVRYDGHRDYYYFSATKNLARRVETYQSVTNRASRTVFQAYLAKDGSGEVSYYRHSAFCGRFQRIDRSWYLEITPTYHFTWDGHRPSYYRESLLSGIKRLEHNPAVLGQLLMWAEYLREKRDLFSREYPFLGFGSLLTLALDAGLDDDTWRKREDPDEVESPEGPIDELPLFRSIHGDRAHED